MCIRDRYTGFRFVGKSSFENNSVPKPDRTIHKSTTMRVHQIFIIIENAPDGFLRFQLIDPGSKEFFQNPVVDLFSDIISCRVPSMRRRGGHRPAPRPGARRTGSRRIILCASLSQFDFRRHTIPNGWWWCSDAAATVPRTDGILWVRLEAGWPI